MIKRQFCNNLIILFLAIAGFTIQTSCNNENGQSEANARKLAQDSIDKALAFNDSIVKLQQHFMDPALRVMKMTDDSLLKKLSAVQEKTEHSIQKLHKLKTCPGGKELKASALNLFNFYLNMMQDPWKKAIKLYENKGQKMTKEERKKFRNLLTKSAKKEQKFNRIFREEQKSFARSKGFKIEAQNTAAPQKNNR